MNEKNSEKKLAISQKSSADLNVPLSDIAQLHISSLSTPSKADNDSKASSALKENAKFEYKKGVIEFWDNERNNEIENLDIGTDEKSAYGIPYWQSVFEIKQIEKLDGVHIRKMCIYTKKPLSKLPALEFVYDNMLFNVLVRSAKNPTYFKDESDQLLLKYTIALTKRLTNKDYTCTQENAPYFILPLETAVSESVFQEKIDWQEIERTVANDTKQRIPLHNSKLSDKLVFKPNNENKLFFVKYTQTDSSLQGDISIINEEQNTLAKDSKNQSETVKQGPLIQAFALTKETRQFIKNKNKMDVGPETKSTVWLKPEEHRIFPISASVYQASQLIPDILLQIDAFLLIQQLKTVHNLQFIDDALMLEAFTSPSANRKQDYERLEFLGDAVLKFIVSSYLYAKYPTYSEAELTCLRQVMTSNKSFASNAKDLKLHRYIISQSTVRRFWRPPHFQNALDSNKIKHWLTHHLVSDNTLADIIESTVGAAFLSQSIDGAVYAATQLKLPLESIKVWSDLRHIWTSSPASATGQINIDVVRVGEMLGYQFKNYLLVQEALTHGSVMDSLVPCYERLEFLGDAILDFFVTQYIYQKHPTAAPGVLHNLRKSSVNHHILSAICLNMGLDKHIIHVSAEIAASILKAETIHKDMQSKGKDTDEYWLHFNPPKVLSDVIESLMGAILVDSEFDINQVEEFFERWFKPILEKHISVETMAVHPMSQLNTLVQNLGCINWTIQNNTVSSAAQSQVCTLLIHGKEFATASGKNIKEAKKNLAINCCKEIENDLERFKFLCTCHR